MGPRCGAYDAQQWRQFIAAQLPHDQDAPELAAEETGRGDTHSDPAPRNNDDPGAAGDSDSSDQQSSTERTDDNGGGSSLTGPAGGVAGS